MYSEARLSSGATLWRSRGAGAAVIPADGCADLILMADEVFVAGPSTRWLRTRADGADGSLGLRWASGQAPLPQLAELADRLVPLRDVVVRDEARRLEAVMRDAAVSPASLLALTTDGADTQRWTGLVRRAAQRAIPARRVAAELQISERSLRRRMLSAFGYGYATLVRLERAHRAQTLLAGGMSVADAAARSGYADQPHLSREFRRLVGQTPAQFAGSAA